MQHHLPEFAAPDRAIFQAIASLAAWLGGDVEVETIRTTRATPDWTFGSFWAHAERVLDEAARSGTSGFGSSMSSTSGCG